LLDEIDVYGLNEDEMQSYLGRPVDLLSAREVADALTAGARLTPVPTLVLHTKYWAARSERATYADALDNGTVMAATRYCHGDAFTDEDADRGPPASASSRVRRLRSGAAGEMGDRVRCVPGIELDVENPTTVGLGEHLRRRISRRDRRFERPMTINRTGEPADDARIAAI
jgi:ADP-dependent phosphofructokinase/glucokinase